MDPRAPGCSDEKSLDNDNFCYQDVDGGLNSSSSAGGTFKTTEEIISELRRENFRLRLMCFDYEKARKRMINPQDAESSRLFSVEAENLTLKEVLAEKTNLLRSASKTIDALKEENNLLNEKLHEWEEKLHENNTAWRRQYDALYLQLQQARNVVQSLEFQSTTHKREDNGCSTDLTSHISEPGVSPTTNKTEADQGQLKSARLFSEPGKSSISQQRTDKGISRLDEIDILEVSRDAHKSCQVPPSSVSPDIVCSAHEADSAATVSWLSERLNAARRLILDLGNQKLRQDALIAQLRSEQRRLLSTDANMPTSPSAAHSPTASHDRVDVDTVHSERDSLLQQRDKQLSTSGILHSLSVLPAADPSLPGNSDLNAMQCFALTTPSQTDSNGEIAEPHSLTRLRDLYRLVHELQLQLENVRFTQHSFVELINRSLCTSGLDASLLLSPSKRDFNLPVSCNVAVGTSPSLVSDDVNNPAVESVEARNSQLSQANATYGGTHTLSEALNESLEPSFLKDCDVRPLPDSSLNQTVYDLKNFPSSPTSLAQTARSKSCRIFQPTKPPLSVDRSVKSKLPPAIQRLRNSKHHESVSFSEGVTQHPVERHTVNLLSTSLNLDDRSDSGPAVGEVTLVEWQNRQLFERLARATAELRDVLAECTEMGSQWLTTELSQSLIQYLSDQAREPAAVVEDSHSTDKTPTLATPTVEDVSHNRSVRFDRVDPRIAPSDFTELSVGSSFSHLYDAEWRGLETTLSEQAGNKVSVDTQTCSSRPTATVASDVSTQTVSEASDVLVCHRFVSLLLHALKVLHRAVQGITRSADSTHSLSTLPESYLNSACSTWWVSWIQSATHWFQSFLEVLNVMDGSKSTDSITRFHANKDEVHSLLECLERVFNERVDGWIADVEHTLEQIEHSMGGLRDQNERSSTEILRINDELKQALDQKSRLEARVSELETELDDLLNISVPLDEHRTVLQQLAKLEEQMVKNQQFCERLESERRQLRAVVPDDIADAHAVDDLIGQVQVVCSELVCQRRDSLQLQKRYEAISAECSELKRKLTQCLDDFSEQSAMLKQQFDSQLLAAREDVQVKAAENSRLTSELELCRSKQEQLTIALESREAETNHLLDQLSELQSNMQHLQASLAAKTDSARMYADSAATHEQRANALTLELEHLQKEHSLCFVRPATAHAQTSPGGLSKSAEDMHTGILEELPPVDKSDDCRARKYGELKAVAFEIKEKLIRRTDKLEVALTEIARLRSVIQQDKEHASHVLEEVEDLRKQAMRKNRRIHELEAELTRLRKCAIPTDVRTSPSPARTASEVEQPRGAQHGMSTSHLDSAATGSVRAAFVTQPTSLSINGVDSPTADHFSTGSASLLLVSPDQLPERESDVRSSPNIRRELSCPSHIPEPVISSTTNKTDARQLQLGPTQLFSEFGKSAISRQLADYAISQREEIGVPKLSREIHKSCRPLHRTRSRLQHYASEMDRLCCLVLQRLDCACNDCESSKIVDGVDIIIDEATVRLHHILRRLHAFLVANRVSDDRFTKALMADLKTVITSLSQLHRRSLVHSCDDKENMPPSEMDNRNADLFSHATTLQEAGLVQQAEHCGRRYRKLIRGVDSFANELSQTADILAATRINLEQAAGLSVSSERAAKHGSPSGQS